MTYEERQRQVCEECYRIFKDCGYIGRGLNNKCSHILDVMSGWELGQKDTLEEIDKVYNKGGCIAVIELVRELNKG